MLPPGGQGSTYRYVGADARATDDGWESLGDLGYVDADGYLYLVDRRTDMIVTGGANVYPAEVEAALDAHPRVRSCAVIGLPDADLGQRMHAIVEASRPSRDDALRAQLAQRLARYKIPRSFEFVDAPLRDEAGKVRRSALRDARMPRELTMDPRTPVLVGCGQVKQRCDDPREALEPLALMAEAAERAADDAGNRALLRALDSIRVPHGLWQYSNPAALLRERFGCPGAQTAWGPIAGSTSQRMLSHAACEIAAGRRDVVLLVGAEAERTKRRAKAAGVALDWTEQRGDGPDRGVRLLCARSGLWQVGGALPRASAAGVRTVRERPPARARRVGRRAPRADRGALGALLAGGGPESVRVDPEADVGRADRHAERDEPARRVPVHEVPRLEHGGRSGRGADRVLGGGRAAARHTATPLGVSARGDRRVRDHSARRARDAARPGRDPHRGAPRARARGRGGRADRARRSLQLLPLRGADRRGRDRAAARVATSPSRVGSPSRAARSTATCCTRSPR